MTTEFKFLKYHGLSAPDFLKALSNDFLFEISAPIDVEKIANILDVEIDEGIDFERIDIAGCISVSSTNAKIWLNGMENNYEPRRRFTIAHELGHLIKHISPEKGVKEFIDTKKTLNRKDSYWDAKEFEANNFAAQLLMPKSLLIEVAKDVISRYKAENAGKQNMPVSLFKKTLADKFSVSEPAMSFRLNKLGVIN